MTALLRTVGATLRGRDLAAAAATLTYFAGIAVVPWALLSVWTATLVTSPDAVARRLADLRLLVPPEMGALPLWDALADAAVRLGLLGFVVTLFPATFYGEGVRRACLRLVPEPDRLTGWRARLTLIPLVLVAPVLTQLLLVPSGVLADFAREGGGPAMLERIFVTFNVVFVALWVVLIWAFRAVAPGTPGWPAATVGGFGTAAVISGFLQGFVLFLSLPIDLGIPFGGLFAVGVVVAVGLWLFVLHVLFLVGWTATLALDRRLAGDRSSGPIVRVAS